MKKIVFHIITKLDVGGAERVAINIASYKDSDVEQHIVEVIRGTSDFSLRIIEELQQKHIPYHRALLPVLFHFHYLFEKFCAILFPLRFLILWLRYRPTTVHCHTEIPDMAIWLTMKLFPFINVRVVRTIHNTMLWTGMANIGRKVELFMQSRGGNIAISKNVQEAYQQRFGALVPIIYNGVSPVEQKRYDKIVPGRINICFAGRYEEQKGIDILCSIVKALKDDKRYHFHIFGCGRQQNLIDELKSLPNVSVNLPLNGISSYLASFDYLIMPSRHEGLSILALEASFNGLPLLINSCAGLVDTLPTNWPLKVLENSLQEWMHIFKDILPDIDRKPLQEQAYNFVNQHFSMENMQKSYIDFYKV